jgi:hypothetical protein
LVTAVFVFIVAVGHSSVCSSQTIYAPGVGTDSCSTYIAQISASPGKSVSRVAPDAGKTYYARSTTYLEWLLGFLTGYNAPMADPQKQITLHATAVDLYVRDWCSRNPTSNIFTAIHQLAGKE